MEIVVMEDGPETKSPMQVSACMPVLSLFSFGTSASMSSPCSFESVPGKSMWFECLAERDKEEELEVQILACSLFLLKSLLKLPTVPWS